MLAAIGVDSIDELFADIPDDLRLDRPLELPDGLSETEVFDLLAALAARNADADAETCFIGAGMYDHYVPALVDAIISRSEFLTPYTPYQPEVSQGGLQVMFEFQTAISELTALPVANASLYEGPVVGRLGRLPGARRRARSAASARRLARPAPARAGDARDLCAAASTPRWSRSGSRDGRHRPPPSSTTPSTPRRRRRLRPEPELPRLRSRTSRRWRAAAHDAGALCVASVDAPDARRAAAAGRVRRRRRGRRGPAARQPPRLRRPVVRLLRRDRGAPAPDARPDRGRDHRRRRAPRLRARAADPRAAHPPREGDPQHLHLPGAERARRDDLPRLARPARDRRARRAAGPAHRLRARGARGGRRGRAAARGAGRRASSRSRSTRRSPEVLDRVARRGSPPATRWAASTRSTTTACWSRSPSAARRRTSTGSPTPSAARSLRPMAPSTEGDASASSRGGGPA